MKQIDVSIIITTRNEEENIAACLRSVKNQNYPPNKLEIILIDNNSTDKTKEIASQFTSLVFNQGPERSAQRNFGISKSRGKYILYLDADMTLNEEVISECMQRCKNEGLVALYIPERIIGTGFWIKVRDFERNFYNATCIDAVRLVLKESALKIHGFDESLNGPEDWDFDRRIGECGEKEIINVPLYHNEGTFNLKRYLQKKGYYSRDFRRYMAKWGGGDEIIRKQFGFWFRYFEVFIENGKWKRLLRYPILAMGMYILRATIGIIYLSGNIRAKKSKKDENSNVGIDKAGVLILSPFYKPNIGGVETHLNDLINYLRREGQYRVYVLTYQPITTEAKGASFEINRNVEIRRIPWIGHNLFHSLEPYPVLEFLYITPWLLLNTLSFMLRYHKRISIIHAQGLNAAFISRIISSIFKTRVVVSIHAIYNLKSPSVLANLICWTMKKADTILTLSDASKRELIKIGLTPENIDVYTYWVDQEVFKPFKSSGAKKKLGLENKFVVLFIGRFIEIKGMDLLLKIAKKVDNKICFVFIGDGPLANGIKEASVRFPNVMFLGKIDNHSLPHYYNAADILCVPSKYEEGFGRVIVEALSCGTPVVASNRGGIIEAIDERIGLLIEPTEGNLRRAIEFLYQTPERLHEMQCRCRKYAVSRFSERNAERIVKYYDG